MASSGHTVRKEQNRVVNPGRLAWGSPPQTTQWQFSWVQMSLPEIDPSSARLQAQQQQRQPEEVLRPFPKAKGWGPEPGERTSPRVAQTSS